VGKVLGALDKSGQQDNTIVIFTSDHGYHLGEHDFWAKVSLHDESARVPLIICVPGKQPAVCDSLVELIDLFPTISSLCGRCRRSPRCRS
jgi:iduronate 2-sulfatase